MDLDRSYSPLWIPLLLIVLVSIAALMIFLPAGILSSVGWMVLIALFSLFVSWRSAVYFIYRFYQLDSAAEAGRFLRRRIFGQMNVRPFMVVKGGKITLV